MNFRIEGNGLFIWMMALILFIILGKIGRAGEHPVLYMDPEHIALEGNIEVVSFFSKSDFYSGESKVESDIASSIELQIMAFLRQDIEGIIALSWDDDSEMISVDEAFIIIDDLSHFTISVGRFELPFGHFDTYMINDPFTIELGETNETALQITFIENGLFKIHTGVFNGEVNKRKDEDTIDDYYAAGIINIKEDISFGLAYISDLADTDFEITSSAEDGDSDEEERELEKKVEGATLFTSLKFGVLGIEAHYLKFDRFDPDKDGNAVGDKPCAWNIESALFFMDERITLAVNYQGAIEVPDIPETAFGIALSYEGFFSDTATLSLEYARHRFDERWSANDTITTMSAEMCVEF